MTPMSPETDGALLRAWRGGDRHAGAELYRRHAASVSRFFRNKVAARDLPDLIQTTFLTCCEREENLRDETSFRGFLLGVARNTLFRHYRDHYRKHDKIDFGISSVVDLGLSPTGIIAEKQLEQRLLAALRGLPIEHQILLELYYWEGMQGRELAEVYDLPEGTVRTRLRRARQLLAESFASVESAPLDEADPGAFEAWVEDLRERLDDGEPLL